MAAETHPAMGNDEFASHERMYRRFVLGIALTAAQTLIIVILLAYLFV
jgi:hypothetical protein